MEARRHVAVSFVLLMGVYLSSDFLMCASASGGDLNEAKVSCEVQRLGKKMPLTKSALSLSLSLSSTRSLL